jgi:hypothetical protein
MPHESNTPARADAGIKAEAARALAVLTSNAHWRDKLTEAERILRAALAG